MPLPFPFDFKNPDYVQVFEWRIERLNRLRAAAAADVAAERPGYTLGMMRTFYRDNPAQFMIDWGMTYDPRNVSKGLPSFLPFMLFPKQEELVHWLVARWKGGERGLIEKSRDMGITWVTMSLACTFCLFYPQMSIGCGSRKEDLVDGLGDPDSMIEKARMFMGSLPPEFRGTWTRKRDSSYMKVIFPDSGSILTGEAGDNIGRGGRNSLYIVDEAAHVEHPKMIDASLSATTDCRIDLSSVNGMGTPFAQRAHDGTTPKFTFHWRDDPRKDEAWYAKKSAETDPVTMAQEYDIDYSASVEGVLIPSAWAQAIVDAHVKLGIEITGTRRGAMDVADEGKDKCAFGGKFGILLEYMDEWSGAGSLIFSSVERVFLACDQMGYKSFHYDADGMGSGVRSDSFLINERRVAQGGSIISAEPHHGSGAVQDPDGEMVKERKNKNFFQNYKSQSWWALRQRVQRTYLVLTGQVARNEYHDDDLISIDSRLPFLAKLLVEMSQVTYTINTAGKVLINKAPEGTKSPNLADTVVMLYAPGGSTVDVWSKLAG